MNKFEKDIQLNPNELVKFLGKPPEEFTREDLMKFIEAKGIKILNFRYVAEDGKLKSLNYLCLLKMLQTSLLLQNGFSGC